MAKINRQRHKILGGSGSSDNFAQFGSLVAAAPIKTKDLATIQALPAWDDGFQESIFGANKDILLEDLNAAFLEHSTQIAYLFQAGVPEWEVATEYSKGSLVQRTTGGGDATGELYMSLVDGNVGNAIPVQTDNANWRWINSPQVPAGVMFDWTGIVAPGGFVLGDGAAYSRVTLSGLFANTTLALIGTLVNGNAVVTGIPSTANLQPGYYISGTGVASGARILTVDGPNQATMTLPATSDQTPGTLTYAANPLGDGSTTFNVADTRRRVTVGAGGAGNAVLANAPGAVGGEDSHVLTIAEMPSHVHTENGFTAGGGTHNGLVRQGTNDTPANAALDTDPTGGDQPHNNIQKSIVFMKIIKT